MRYLGDAWDSWRFGGFVYFGMGDCVSNKQQLYQCQYQCQYGTLEQKWRLIGDRQKPVKAGMNDDLNNQRRIEPSLLKRIWTRSTECEVDHLRMFPGITSCIYSPFARYGMGLYTHTTPERSRLKNSEIRSHLDPIKAQIARILHQLR